MKNIEDVKRQYFDENGLYAEDEEYELREPNEQYRDMYWELCKENSAAKSLYEKNDFYEYNWERLFISANMTLFIIQKSTNKLCGYVELKEITSKQPELGIEIYPQYQRQGIGTRAIIMMVKKARRIHPVKSYKIRIYYDNLPSINMFEKLGAVKVGEEENEMIKALETAKSILSGKDLEDFVRAYNKVADEEDRGVCVYELLADSV